MRLFQNFSAYPGYLGRVEQLARAANADTFESRLRVIDDDRYCGLHMLKPVMDRDPEAFITCCNDEVLQKLWARENGMSRNASAEEILLAQIEAHRAEVFYNIDPMLYPSSFVRKLPASVRSSIAWRAAPSGQVDFTAYNWVVCNFPSILAEHQRRGCRTAYFFPAADPEMETFAHNTERPIDVLFVGGYTRHHMRRAELLTSLARTGDSYATVMHLESSRFTKIAESAIGRLLPLARYRRPPEIRRVSRAAIFGRDLFRAISQAKIVLNGAIDMAGNDRGNMRCFEAMSCGALLLSDAGVYPDGMENDVTLVTYESAADSLEQISALCRNPERRLRIAAAGHDLMKKRYSKEQQWAAFNALV
jgi:hypothetical protein